MLKFREFVEVARWRQWNPNFKTQQLDSTLEKYRNDPMCFVHFGHTDRVGINPKLAHSLTGIFAYPISEFFEVYDYIKGEIKRTGVYHGGSINFGKRKWMWLMKPKRPDKILYWQGQGWDEIFGSMLGRGGDFQPIAYQVTVSNFATAETGWKSVPVKIMIVASGSETNDIMKRNAGKFTTAIKKIPAPANMAPPPGGWRMDYPEEDNKNLKYTSLKAAKGQYNPSQLSKLLISKGYDAVYDDPQHHTNQYPVLSPFEPKQIVFLGADKVDIVAKFENPINLLTKVAPEAQPIMGEFQ